MAIYLIEEYAGAMTKDDIIDLFEIIRESYSLSEAARLCELKRKTIYDWNKADYIKLKTKKKVLNAVIKVQPEKTLDFMLKRFEENTADILYLYFNLLYEDAIVEESEMELFIQIFERFNKIKREYSGLIHKKLGEEIGDMSQIFKDKAIRLGIPISPPTLTEMRVDDIVKILPDAMRELLSENYSGLIDFSIISEELNLPIELFEALFTIYSELEGRAVRWYAQETYSQITSSEGHIDQIHPKSYKNKWWIDLPQDPYGQLTSSAAVHDRRPLNEYLGTK